ncbi:MAG: GyrI-like domain-containing protein [Bdellovibrionales bacterium]
MKKIVLGFALAMFTSFIVTGFYLGYYKSVIFSNESNIELHLLYMEHLGPYHLINEKIESVEAWTNSNNIECPLSFGEFFDDPEKQVPEKLNSHAGCVVDEKPSMDLPDNIKYKVLSIESALVAKFEGSPALGPLKVYPEAKDWFAKNKKPWDRSLEIYFLKDGNFSTKYIFPIDLDY